MTRINKNTDAVDKMIYRELSYLKASGLKLGILINFGSSRVEYTHIAN